MDRSTLIPPVFFDLLLPLSGESVGLAERQKHNVKLHSGAGAGMARVARFILGQTDIRKCAPFLINRDNVI